MPRTACTARLATLKPPVRKTRDNGGSEEDLVGARWEGAERQGVGARGVGFVRGLTCCSTRRQLHQVDRARGLWWTPIHGHVIAFGSRLRMAGFLRG